jgi:nucleoside-diphosphate-sugar epimerase
MPLLNDDFELVIHAAGKAHIVPKTGEEEKLFFDVNYRGTINLLKALEKNPPKSFVFISTVAVYGLEEGERLTEDSPLNGNSPYALSKIKAEQAVQEWSAKYGVPAVILRLPLIAANNAPGNLGSMIKAIRKGYYFRIGEGKARRSMVLAKDLADFIPQLFQKSGTFHLTDGHHPGFQELEEYIAGHYHKKIKSVPGSVISFAAKLGDIIPGFPINTYRLQKLQNTLTFSDAKARNELGWNPTPVIGNLFPSPRPQNNKKSPLTLSSQERCPA